jgi:hypothetical protein
VCGIPVINLKVVWHTSNCRKDNPTRQIHDFLMRIFRLESLGLGYIGDLVAVDEDSAIEDDFPGGVNGY